MKDEEISAEIMTVKGRIRIKCMNRSEENV
jgi:hypothetical protein